MNTMCHAKACQGMLHRHRAVFGQFGMPYCSDFKQPFSNFPAKLIQNLYKMLFSYVQRTSGCVWECRWNVWDQFCLRNFRNWSYKHQQPQNSTILQTNIKTKAHQFNTKWIQDAMPWHAMGMPSIPVPIPAPIPVWDAQFGPVWGCLFAQLGMPY